MAVVKYLTQGLDESKNHLNEVKEVIGSDEFTKILISSAYLRENAVVLLNKELEKNKDKIVVLVGIRNGATSVQALKSLLATGVELYAVDTGSTSSIFHVKNYVGYNEEKAVAITGSANFTPSGLVRNIEGSSIITLDLTSKEDKDYLDTLINDVNTLIRDYSENVIRITNDLIIEKLLQEGRLIDEKTEPIIKRVGKNSKNENIVPRMKLKISKIAIGSRRKAQNNKQLDIEVNNLEPVVLMNNSLELIEIWRSKELVERDLNVPSNSKKTNVTGSMLLKKGQYDVNQQTYFRYEAFSELAWKNRLDKPTYFEYANAEFYFIIDGVEYGKHELEIKHDTRTDTATYLQKQPMTHLMWGSCKTLISNRNLLGKELTLYKVKGSSNEFVININ